MQSPTVRFDASWLVVLAGVICALAATAWTFSVVGFDQVYTDFIAGGPARGDESKTFDYAIAYLVIAYGLTFIGILGAWFGRLQSNRSDAQREPIRELLFAVSLPAVFYLFSVIWLKHTAFNFEALYFSAGLIVLAALLVSIAGGRKNGVREAGLATGLTVLSLFSVLAIPLTENRLSPYVELPFSVLNADLVAFMPFVAGLLFIGLCSRLFKGAARRRGIFVLAVLIQALLPLLYFIAVPAPMKQDGEVIQFWPAARIGLLFVFPMLLLSYRDLVQRVLAVHRGEADLPHLLSPWAVLAVLMFIKSGSVVMPDISNDDYHTGELIVPYWMLMEFGVLPFSGAMPAHGLHDYVWIALADLVSDPTSSNIPLGKHLATFVFLPVAFFALRRVLPLYLVAAVLVIAFPTNIHLLLITVLALLFDRKLLQRRPAWLLTWVVAGLGLTLFRLGHGAAFTLASLPVAAYQFVGLWRDSRPAALRTLAILAGGLAVLLLLPASREVLIAVVRVLAENESINAVAYGIPWRHTLDKLRFYSDLPPMLYQFVKVAWLPVIVLGLPLGVHAWRTLVSADRLRAVGFILILTLLCVFLIPYLLGRIDSNLSRSGDFARWVFAAGVPMLLWLVFRGDSRRLGLLAAFAVTGIFHSAPIQQLSLARFTGKALPAVDYPAGIIDGRRLGLPGLGAGVADAEHVRRLRALKSELGKLLREGETYLDLTNRGAQYVYTGYPVPVESSSFYNLAHVAQQRRAIERLATGEQPVPVVLIDGDNVHWDAANLALRTRLLYRYLALNYLPVQRGPFTFLVTPGRMAELGQNPTREEALRLWSAPIGNRDLAEIPAAWGRSAASLAARLDTRVPEQGFERAALQHFEPVGAGRYRPLADKALVEFRIRQPVRGRDAGMLRLNIRCEGRPADTDLIVFLHWATTARDYGPRRFTRFVTQRDGTHLVPMDANPAWFFDEDIRYLRIRFNNATDCEFIDLPNPVLLQEGSVSGDARLRDGAATGWKYQTGVRDAAVLQAHPLSDEN